MLVLQNLSIRRQMNFRRVILYLNQLFF